MGKRTEQYISEVMDLIYKAWMKCPDLRLCQLIGNCFPAGDNYHKEDEELIKSLKNIYEVEGDIR